MKKFWESLGAWVLVALVLGVSFILMWPFWTVTGLVR